MCTVAQSLINQGMQQGMQRGIKRGKESILSVLRSMGIDEELIRKAEMEAAELDEEQMSE